MTQQPWHALNNAYAGRPAVLIGKGPSLQTWLDAGSPIPDNAVLIGINHAAGSIPCDYAVTTHGEAPYLEHISTRWVVGLPLWPHTTKPECWQRPAWCPHWFLHVCGWHLLDQTRDQIADLHSLWNHTSSAHPGIHLAWYLGCSSLTLVGIDGGNGYAEAMHKLSPPPGPDAAYASMRKSTERACNHLFGNAWSHWGQP